MKRETTLVLFLGAALVFPASAQPVAPLLPIVDPAMTSPVPVGPQSALPVPEASIGLPQGEASTVFPDPSPETGITEDMLRSDLPTSRSNPFLPRLTDEERSLSDAAARRDRDIREFRTQIRSELMPAILDEVRRELQEERQRNESTIDSRVGAALAGIETNTPSSGGVRSAMPGSAGTQAGASPDGEAEATILINGRPRALPDATFVACVNGKALYRDKTSILFEQDEDTTTCAR